jgi:outer membrane lipoprotein-sorting protein
MLKILPPRNRILLVLGALVMFSLRVQAQTVDEILSKNAQAHGGLEKIKSVTSMKLTGKIQDASGSAAVFTMQKKRPNLLRIDSTYRGKKAAEGYDGNTSWQTSLIGDTVELPEDEIKNIREDAEFDSPLIDYREKGNAIELVGKEDVNGTAAHKLKITLNDGSAQFLYLDVNTGLELKETRKVKQAGQEAEVNMFFSNYKQVNGVTLPFSIKSKTAGKPDQQITIEGVEANPAVDDSVFKMPAAASGQSSP